MSYVSLENAYVKPNKLLRIFLGVQNMKELK